MFNILNSLNTRLYIIVADTTVQLAHYVLNILNSFKSESTSKNSCATCIQHVKHLKQFQARVYSCWNYWKLLFLHYRIFTVDYKYGFIQSSTVIPTSTKLYCFQHWINQVCAQHFDLWAYAWNIFSMLLIDWNFFWNYGFIFKRTKFKSSPNACCLQKIVFSVFCVSFLL